MNTVFPWLKLSEDKLLEYRICELKLKIQNTPLLKYVEQLNEELEARGITKFKPKVYLGDEWYHPEKTCLIAVPFYLAHPRLKELEKSLMLEVEGGDPREFVKLLRHECGHCIDSAYKFSSRKKWKKIFGDPKKNYDVDNYRPRPYSKAFVRHLDNWYSQSHPDEDFAETFAVWLNPDSDWQKKYSRWPIALKKLKYLDELMTEIATKPAKIPVGRPMGEASRLQSKLQRYYLLRKKEQADDSPLFFDKDLTHIFYTKEEKVTEPISAAKFIRKNRKDLLDSVSYWTGERKYTVNHLLKRLIERCRQLNLRADASDHSYKVELATYVSTLVTNYLFTGRFKRRV